MAGQPYRPCMTGTTFGSRLDLPRSRARFIAFGVAAILLFMILGGRLFQMQIVNGEQYAARAAAKAHGHSH